MSQHQGNLKYGSWRYVMVVQTPPRLDLQQLDSMLHKGLFLRVLLNYDPPRSLGEVTTENYLEVTIVVAVSVLLGTDGEGVEGYVRYFREVPFRTPSAAVGISTGQISGAHLLESYRNQWLLNDWANNIPPWIAPTQVVICQRRNRVFENLPVVNHIVMEHLVRLHQEVGVRLMLNDGNSNLLIGVWTQLGRYISESWEKWGMGS